MAKQKIIAQFVTHVAENDEELKLTNFPLHSLTIKQIDKSHHTSSELSFTNGACLFEDEDAKRILFL